MKLLIRGGSVAAGYGVRKSYADIMAQSLLPEGIVVLNRSRYRETSFDGIGTFDEDIHALRPDILLIQFGVDDAFGYVYRSEFQENIVGLVRRARLCCNPAIVLATSQTFDDPGESDAINIFYRSTAIVAQDLDCLWVPVHHYWAHYREMHHLQNSDLVQSDSRYPNSHGHRVIARAVMTGLRSAELLPGRKTVSMRRQKP